MIEKDKGFVLKHMRVLAEYILIYSYMKVNTFTYDNRITVCSQCFEGNPTI